MIESRIVRQGEVFAIEADGRTIPMYAYMSYQPARACYGAFRDAGIKLFCTGVYAGDRGINPASDLRPFRPGFWKGPDTFEFSAVDEDFRRIVGSAAPGEVYILPRLMLDPPGWWETLHPDALCRDAQGLAVRVSFSGDGFVRAAEPAMRAFQDWLAASGWERYVVGWHLAGGGTEEFNRPSWRPMQYLDYSEAAKRAYRDWLLKRYGTLEAVCAAWGEAYSGADDIEPPGPAQRRYALRGQLRDGALERPVMDFYRFHSEALALTVVAACRKAKEITGGKQVMGAFYGYTVNTRSPEGGHRALGLLLESDAVDFLASPFAYVDQRAQGIDWPFMGPIQSAHAHGKPWFMEADVRTLLSRPISQCMPFANPAADKRYEGPVWWGPDTLEGSLGQMGKAFAKVLTHGTAIWWFDMWGGWYDAPELMRFQRMARELYASAAKSGRMRQSAQIAVFVDETLHDHLAGGIGAGQAFYDLLAEMGWIGAPYHVFLLSDLPSVDPGPYRLALFPFALEWTPERREALERWKTGGRMLLFTGIPDADNAGPGVLLGMDCQEDRGALLAAQFRLGTGALFPEQAPELPAILPKPGESDVVLLRLADGQPGLVLRRKRDVLTAWSLPLLLPHALIRELALLAGVHIYGMDGDAVYANHDYVALHAHSAGVKRIYLPGKGQLEDVWTGERLDGQETYADFEMAFGETRLFRVIWG